MLTRLAGGKGMLLCPPLAQRKNAAMRGPPGSTLAKPAKAGVARGHWAPPVCYQPLWA